MTGFAPSPGPDAIRIAYAQGEITEITERFGPYRRPTEVTIPKFQAIQEKALEFALLIDELCPQSKQKATALTQLELCKMSANAAIAIYSPQPESK